MASILKFQDAEKARANITNKQLKDISALYRNWAKELSDKAKEYEKGTTPSSAVQARQVKELRKYLNNSSRNLNDEIKGEITNSIYLVAENTVKSNISWLRFLGIDTKETELIFNSVPDNVVRKLVSGQIYEGGWNLSKAIWSDTKATQKDLYTIVAKGLAQNQPIYEIANELSTYVNPDKKLDWNLKMADGKRIYKKKVDYNAQRLARTLTQHSYQQSFIEVTENNPFITGIRWNANGSRVCDICLARHGTIYDKDEVPMDHPNGMCVLEPVIEGGMDGMIDQLADWVNSEDGTYPDIDEFAKNFGFTGMKKEESKEPKGINWLDFVKLSTEEKNKKQQELGYDFVTPGQFRIQIIEELRDMGYNDIPPYKELLKNYDKLSREIKKQIPTVDYADFLFPNGPEDKGWFDLAFTNTRDSIIYSYRDYKTGELDLDGGKKYWNDFVSLISKRDADDIRFLAIGDNKFSGITTPDKKDRAYYNPGYFHISMDLGLKEQSEKGRFATFLHEYGHFLDDVNNPRYSNIQGKMSADTEFYNAIREDYRNMRDNWTDSKVTIMIEPDKTVGIQDAISGLSTIEEGKQIWLKWGHEEDYWKRKGDNAWMEITSETLAEMNVATFYEDNSVYFDMVMPKSFNFFKNMIKK